MPACLKKGATISLYYRLKSQNSSWGQTQGLKRISATLMSPHPRNLITPQRNRVPPPPLTSIHPKTKGEKLFFPLWQRGSVGRSLSQCEKKRRGRKRKWFLPRPSTRYPPPKCPSHGRRIRLKQEQALFLHMFIGGREIDIVHFILYFLKVSGTE